MYDFQHSVNHLPAEQADPGVIITADLESLAGQKSDSAARDIQDIRIHNAAVGRAVRI